MQDIFLRISFTYEKRFQKHLNILKKINVKGYNNHGILLSTTQVRLFFSIRNNMYLRTITIYNGYIS